MATFEHRGGRSSVYATRKRRYKATVQSATTNDPDIMDDRNNFSVAVFHVQNHQNFASLVATNIPFPLLATSFTYNIVYSGQ